MKNTFLIPFLLFSVYSFSQKKVIKKIESNLNKVIIHSEGLDLLTLENSNSNYTQVILHAENYEDQLINLKHKSDEFHIGFQFEGFETREVIFRKFITKRLQRASAIVKVPKGKKVIIFGENIDIASKSFHNNLDIYIENGIVKLNTIKANTLLKLYSGNVYASIRNTNVNATSSSGNIEIDGVAKENKYQIEQEKFQQKLIITTLKGNLFFKSN